MLSGITQNAWADAEFSEKDSLTILFTGSYRGRVLGCLCPGGEYGGLSRRWEKFNQIFTGKSLLCLDSGGFLDLDPEGGKLRSLCTFLGLRRMGLQTSLVGLRDLFYGVNFINEIADSSGVDFVCANLVDQNSSRPIFDPFVDITHQNWKLRIIGITRYQPERIFPGYDSWTTLNPDSALKKLGHVSDKDFDICVLLSDLPEQEIIELVNRNPIFQIVFTSYRQSLSQNPLYLNSACVLKSVNDGGSIDYITIPPDFRSTGHISYSNVRLEESVKPHKEMEEWLNNCLNAE